MEMIEPSDAAGIDTVGRVLMSSETKSYVYSYVRTLSDLYLLQVLNEPNAVTLFIFESGKYLLVPLAVYSQRDQQTSSVVSPRLFSGLRGESSASGIL